MNSNDENKDKENKSKPSTPDGIWNKFVNTVGYITLIGGITVGGFKIADYFLNKTNETTAITQSIDDDEKLDFLKELGLSQIKAGEFDDAIATLEKVLEMQPVKEQTFTLYELGTAYNGLENYNKAVDCFEKATELRSEWDLLWNQLGFACSKIGDYDKAINAYQKEIELDNKETIYSQDIGIDATIVIYKNLLKKSPDSYTLKNKLADCLTERKEKGDITEATDIYEKIVKTDKADEHDFLQLGKCYEELKEFEKAKTIFEKATELHPSESTWLYLSGIYFKLGQEDKGKETFDKFDALKNKWR